MASNIRETLESMIRENGPVSIATFMGLVLPHYYGTRDPLGREGDFITAPEISQMFGEMIGVFLADAWIKMGGPSPVALTEAGPGRGTLMADILRATRHVPGFADAVRIHLIETSPSLRARQRDVLGGYDVTWHDDITSLPDMPVLFVGNEFLDALPIHQIQYAKGQWHERVIGLSVAGDLVYGLGLPVAPPMGVQGAAEGDIFEHAPARVDFTKALADHIRHHGGVAVLIDYGHDRSACGDTLQAVRDHKFVEVLSNIGDADLTSHVDFDALKRAIEDDVAVSGPVGQGAFLYRLGIGLRAEKLQQPDMLHRLASPDQMGELFRVMAFCGDRSIHLEGFA